ncbi:protein of unknown function DUF558 domain-containing protein [Theileria equi strain WA]|uniref:16S rRNA (uracil(1498)-N(3))-methyltransferase n=1 Tax=Theileria equi strain WA TaxID=1537102 RepID=L0B3L3_THEEQ|nr:protein of unknown function DUF558 domain-containing protein [Theileria equi strain WA]AFZ81704.1 protein of unknown function DUF558 domain-containing protein [Theileria equi strain WA]|eukprot:XP_004831370.1 protein of unknown function DUF558 domain-containing protein [Theileria equi strain WA]
MNLLLFRHSDILVIDDDLFVDVIDRVTLNHIVTVLRVSIGKELKVGIIGSKQGTARVVAIEKDRIRLQLYEEFKNLVSVPNRQLVDLVIGIPRPKSLDKLLQYSASIGVGKVNLVCSSRVELSYLNSHKLENEHIEKSLLLGLQQGVDTVVPEVKIFKSMGEYERESLSNLNALKLIAHPGSEDTLGSLGINKHIKGPIVVAIGPEGGWLDDEVDLYKRMGFKPFSITDRILRTEVAVVAILSQLSLLLNDKILRNGLEPANR